MTTTMKLLKKARNYQINILVWYLSIHIVCKVNNQKIFLFVNKLSLSKYNGELDTESKR